MPDFKAFTSRLRARFREPDFLLAVVVYAASAAAFLPVTRWLAATTLERERLLNAFAVLAISGALVVFGRRARPRRELRLELGRRAFLSLVGGYGFLVGAWLTRVPHLVIPAYCLVAGSFLLFLFGPGVSRITLALLTAFGGFIYLTIGMERLDWPLRMLAGKWSAWALAILGRDVELGVIEQNGLPELLLLVEGQPFNVAAECNGFGVIASSLLAALLFSIYRRLGIADLLIHLVAALAAGFAFNTLRIVVIVLLAPHMMGSYRLMHEVVGLVAFWTCLAAVWWLFGPRAARAHDSPGSAFRATRER